MQSGTLRTLASLASTLLLFSCATQPAPTTPRASAPTSIPSAASTSPRATSSPSLRIGAPPEIARLRVVFVREHGIFQANADGSDEQPLIDLEGLFEYQPDWSPDGRWLALRTDEESAGGTVLVSSDGKRVDYIARDLGLMGGAADWAPDSRRLVLTGKRPTDQSFGLYVIDVVAYAATRITPQDYEAQYPAWSPTGDRIAFTRVDPSTNDFDLWTIAPDGTGETQLTNEPEAENYSAWSPDGAQLVYHSGSNDSLRVLASDGSGSHPVAPGGEPQWEPGAFIIFDCPIGADPHGRSCVVRPDGSGLSQLPLGDEAVFPNWVPQPGA